MSLLDHKAFDKASPLATTPAAEWALDVLRGEMEAIAACLASPPQELAYAVHVLAGSRLPVLCCGVGKSGLVAAKIAATLSSLGTPAFTLSAGDATHGDLGSVMQGSVVMLFSNSGTTTELQRIIPGLKARHCHLIGLIGRKDSPLAEAVDTLVELPIAREADHLDMAPTASTTLQMALGDAMAVAASRLRGFTREDFLKSHPAGALGQRIQPVSSVMHSGEALPVAAQDWTLAQAIAAMSRGRLGAVCVIDTADRLVGLVVDGDIRRAIEARLDLYTASVASVMRRDPKTLSIRATIGDALDKMRAHGAGLSVLPVTDDAGYLQGMVHSVDLVQSL